MLCYIDCDGNAGIFTFEKLPAKENPNTNPFRSFCTTRSILLQCAPPACASLGTPKATWNCARKPGMQSHKLSLFTSRSRKRCEGRLANVSSGFACCRSFFQPNWKRSKRFATFFEQMLPLIRLTPTQPPFKKTNTKNISSCKCYNILPSKAHLTLDLFKKPRRPLSKAKTRKKSPEKQNPSNHIIQRPHRRLLAELQRLHRLPQLLGHLLGRQALDASGRRIQEICVDLLVKVWKKEKEI